MRDEVEGRAGDGGDALLLSIGLSPIASVISNPRLPDNSIVAANGAFRALTGYGEHEIVGRNRGSWLAPPPNPG